MGDVGLARYEPALLPPCQTIEVLSYSNCQRSTHSMSKLWFSAVQTIDLWCVINNVWPPEFVQKSPWNTDASSLIALYLIHWVSANIHQTIWLVHGWMRRRVPATMIFVLFGVLFLFFCTWIYIIIFSRSKGCRFKPHSGQDLPSACPISMEKYKISEFYIFFLLLCV